jgi:transcription-repair coupling factor (superfamily II helicase)
VVSDERRMSEAVSDLSAFFSSWNFEKEVLTFPALQVDPYRGLTPHFDIVAARARALSALVEGDPVVIVAHAAALLVRTASPSVLARGILKLESGGIYEPGQIERVLLDAGYQNEDPVMAPGDFARRGMILDIHPPGFIEPLRLEFTGEELEEIRTFDPETQRTTGIQEKARIHPAREWIFTEEHRRELMDELEGEELEEELVARMERESFLQGARR